MLYKKQADDGSVKRLTMICLLFLYFVIFSMLFHLGQSDLTLNHETGVINLTTDHGSCLNTHVVDVDFDNLGLGI